MRYPFLVPAHDHLPVEPGMIDMDEEKFRDLCLKIEAAIISFEKVILFLDFDDTIIYNLFVEQHRNNPDFPKEKLINPHLVEMVAQLYLRFGPSIQMEILSARLSDEHISSQEEHLKIQTLLPMFLELVRKRLIELGGGAQVRYLPENHRVVKKHCLMGLQRFAIKKRKEGASKNSEDDETVTYTDHYDFKKAAIKDTRDKHIFYVESEEILNSYFLLQPKNHFYKVIEHLPKGYYLTDIEINALSTCFCVHFDDNDWHLDHMSSLRLKNLETVRVVPRTGEVKLVRRLPAPVVAAKPLVPDQLSPPFPRFHSSALFPARRSASLARFCAHADLVEQAAAAHVRANPAAGLPPRSKALSSLFKEGTQPVLEANLTMTTPAVGLFYRAVERNPTPRKHVPREQTPAPGARRATPAPEARKPTPMAKKRSIDPTTIASNVYAPRWQH